MCIRDRPIIKRDSSLVVGVYDTNYHRSMIVGFAVYNDSEAYFIGTEDALNCTNFKNFISDKKIEKYGYDIKKSINAAKWHGLEIENYVFDLQLASYILNPSLKDEIRSVCEYYEYYDVFYDEEVYGKGAKKKVTETSRVEEHLIKQAKAIYILKDQAIEKLNNENQFELYKDVEMPVAKILARMEFQGAKVDSVVLKQLEEQFGREINILEKEIHTLANREFNIASPKQLGEVLFEDLGLPNGKKTKTGYSLSLIHILQLHMNLVNMIMVVQDRFATIIMVLDGGVLVMMKVFIVQVTLQFVICLNAGILIVMNY